MKNRIWICVIVRRPEPDGLAIVAAGNEFEAARVLGGELDAEMVEFERERLPYNMRDVGDADDSVAGVLCLTIPGVL
jgi:hypothetical protein